MKLLMAYDKNFSSSAVLEKTLEMAKQYNAYVYLVRTCSTDTSAQEIEDMKDRLNDLKKNEFKQEGIESEIDVLIRGLSPGEDIVQFAKEKQIDQIIIGIKKRSKVGKMVFGSTAQFIILEAHCPVLSVK